MVVQNNVQDWGNDMTANPNAWLPLLVTESVHFIPVIQPRSGGEILQRGNIREGTQHQLS